MFGFGLTFAVASSHRHQTAESRKGNSDGWHKDLLPFLSLRTLFFLLCSLLAFRPDGEGHEHINPVPSFSAATNTHISAFVHDCFDLGEEKKSEERVVEEVPPQGSEER